MFDAEILGEDARGAADVFHGASLTKPEVRAPRFLLISKRASDLIAALLLLPIAALAGLVILVLNPFFNRGPLLYRQTRMGQNCVPFTAYKFRSMTVAAPVARGAFDALEESRITGLGRLLRKSRIDELPQVLNILRGEMGLVGPRPDFIDHARVYLDTIPGYRERHCVRPGVTGLAQTEVGYVSDEKGFRRKVAADLTYIRRMGFMCDLKIVLRTIQIVLCSRGR